MKEFIDKIRGVVNLSIEAEKHLYSISTEKKVKKGHVLIRQGQKVKKIFFVKNGCLRSFCLDKNGKEHTLQFAINDWWISDFIAVYNNELATLTVESVTVSNIIEFNSEDIEAMYTTFPDFETFQREKLKRHVVSLHKRILNQLKLSASERYSLFLEEYPDIEKYTPNYHIASYLGVTQQSLSRIRVDNTKK